MMWMTLACAALTAAPAQADGLTAVNVRSTYGVRGAERKDNKFLPGDQFVLSFDLDGITIDDNGKVQYSTSIEVLDNRDKLIFRQEPKPLEVTVALGGKRLPAFAAVNIGQEQPAGTYTVNVVVTDRASKQTHKFTKKFEVLPKDFGITRVVTTSDPEGQVSTSIFGSGETMWVNFNVVGFGREGGKGTPKVTAELRILDESGKPTLSKSFSGELGKDVPANVVSVPVKFLLGLNRSGKFTVEMKLTDQISKKTAQLTLPLNVLSSN
jgi:hypothetical protein